MSCTRTVEAAPLPSAGNGQKHPLPALDNVDKSPIYRPRRNDGVPPYKTNRGFKNEAGSIAIMFSVLLIPLIGICGLAIDLGMVYNRQTEMRNLATAVAASAAKKLNGTAAGISDAAAAAANTAAAYRYKNHSSSVTWSAAALQFGTSSDDVGPWMDAGAASGNAARVFYVKVESNKLDGAGDVAPALMSVISSAFASVKVQSSVIAGRASVEIFPLAICAMSTTPAAPRANSASAVELVEYGFRRGISYDLMDLNPAGSTPINFAVDPVASPGTAGSSGDMTASNLAPYVCTGTLDIPRVSADRITVASPFPLGGLYKQLNSRFDQYVGSSCAPDTSVPDFNIRAYNSSEMPNPLAWMTTPPNGQTAEAVTYNGKRVTIADLPAPSGTAAQYGPLWSYAKAVPFSSYVAGSVEPASGYTTFTTASWPALYGGQTANVYPSGAATPYKPGNGVNLAKPGSANGPGLRNRRVLNIPLLDCTTLPSSQADVLAIGRFFMTVPATASTLAAEFAGIVPVQRLDGAVEIFR